MLLEICVDNVQSALNAWKGGAKRLELCSSLNLGGLTPSFGLFNITRKTLPKECAIFVMIRPKPGEDYIYDNYDLEVMFEDIKLFKQSGADGFVFGCLNISKQIDEGSCKKLLEAAGTLPCTFHRAFDVVQDPEHSLKTLISLGFARILTSGQKENALLGKNLIKKLVHNVKESDSNLIIIAGAGVNPDNLKEILESTGVVEYHGSARKKSVTDIYLTDESIVKEMVMIGETVKQKLN